MNSPEAKTPRFPSHSAYQWRDIISRFDKATMTIDDFCQQESISKASFKKWQTHYSKSRRPHKKPSIPDFIEIVDTNVTSPPRETCLSINPLPWDIELELGNGIICRIRKT